MQILKRVTVPVLLMMFVTGVALFTLVDGASALDPANAVNRGVNAAGGAGGAGQLDTAVKTVINVLLYVLGAIVVIMIVIGGIRYTISNGESGQITGAKNTILYAVIGLVVAMLAYAIVNFVIDAF